MIFIINELSIIGCLHSWWCSANNWSKFLLVGSNMFNSANFFKVNPHDESREKLTVSSFQNNETFYTNRIQILKEMIFW